MKTNILSVLTMIFFCQIAFAQVDFGIKISTSVALDRSVNQEFISLDNPAHIAEIAFQEQSVGMTVGIHVCNNLGPFFLQSDVEYRTQSFNFNFIENKLASDATPIQLTDTRSIVQLPISAGFKVGQLKIGAGPILSYAVSRSTDEVLVDMFQSRDQKLRTGFHFIVDVKITKNIVISTKYELGFNGPADGYYINSIPMKLRSNPRLLTAGILLSI